MIISILHTQNEERPDLCYTDQRGNERENEICDSLEANIDISRVNNENNRNFFLHGRTMDLEKCTANELKGHLKERGLPVSGNKRALLNRLADAINADTSTDTTPTQPEAMDKPNMIVENITFLEFVNFRNHVASELVYLRKRMDILENPSTTTDDDDLLTQIADLKLQLKERDEIISALEASRADQQ